MKETDKLIASTLKKKTKKPRSWPANKSRTHTVHKLHKLSGTRARLSLALSTLA